MARVRPLDPDAFFDALAALPRVRAYLLALSGGADSVALLDLMSRLRERLAAPLAAVHVHHGLHPAADDWAAHCQALCAALDVPCRIERVQVERRRGESLEAAARRARYAVLARHLPAEGGLLTAHHQDDQAETVLLNLVRGAGNAGLAAMPPQRPFARGWLLRPLLGFRRQALRDYARARGLAWVEDPSNADPAHDRNYLRHHVLPALTARWPQVVPALYRVSRNAAASEALAADLAAADLGRLAGADGSLPVAGLLALSAPRRHNLLRHWLRLGGRPVTPDHAQLAALEHDLLHSRHDARPALVLGARTVYRWRDRLYHLPTPPPLPAVRRWRWPLDRPLTIPALGLHLEPQPLRCAVPGLGAGEVLEVRLREGGERLRPRGAAHHRPLKHWLQDWGVPPWRRDRLPLVYRDNALLAVWGYALAA